VTADTAETVWDDNVPRYAQQTFGHVSVSFPSAVGTHPAITYAPAELAGLRSEPLAIRFARRAADISIAIVGLSVLLPLMLVVLVANRFDSEGPLLFRQSRVGRDGTVFKMIKFRTMCCDAEQRLHDLEAHNESIGGVLFKMRTDPWVTRVGRHLRRLNLDEVPQLFNVLRGEMSIVGPRPLPLRDSDLLATRHPFEFRLRLGVRPGITGEWQVRRTADSDYWHMLLLDMEYLQERSFHHDALLAGKTILVLLKAVLAR
jgi:lipopolysaccharide/colanic/teichoic acid biosynthesis glycosyltransferase